MDFSVLRFIARCRLLAVCVLSIPSLASGEEVRGWLQCEITSNLITQYTDGEVSYGSSYADEFVVGDNLHFHYELEKQPNSELGKLNFQVLDYIRNQEIVSVSTDQISKLQNVDRLHAFEPGRYFELSRDEIRYSQTYSSFALHRYYKSDYTGILTRAFGTSLQVVTLDCRTRRDKIDEAISAFIVN